MKKLPVFNTVSEAYGFTFTNWAYAAKISWAWAAVALVIFVPGTIAGMAIFAELWSQGAWANSFLALVILAAALAVWTMIGSVAVAWHRYVLLDEKIASAYNLRLDRAVWRYMKYFLAITLSLILFFFLIMFTWMGVAGGLNAGLNVAATTIIGSAVYLALMVAAARFSIILPASAIDFSAFTLGRAWRATQGNAWRLIGGFLLAAFPLSIAGNIISATSEAVLGDSFLLLVPILIELALDAMAAFVAFTFLSTSFRFFVPSDEGA